MISEGAQIANAAAAATAIHCVGATHARRDASSEIARSNDQQRELRADVRDEQHAADKRCELPRPLC